MLRYLMLVEKFKKIKSYDVVIVGTGAAGLYTALSLPSKLRIALVTKDTIKENNSNLAQGGISVTFNPDEYQSHIDDTLKAGANHNVLEAVELLVKESARHIDRLIELGAHFDKDDHGNLLTTKEGGHRLNRIVHAKDETGKEVIRVLSKAISNRENVDIFTQTFMVDVLTESQRVCGINAIKQTEYIIFSAPVVVLATGGIGRIYAHTTNASTSTGDGIAAAIRAGLEVKGMEFVQFHPTAYYSETDQRRFLISEAVRGEGGILRNQKGEAFMKDRHPLKDLAPRDIVSRAILAEIADENIPFVYLDVTHLKKEFLKMRFPMIYQTCLQAGVDIATQYIPVRPVEHYVMGGIDTNLNGQTRILGLYAVGETTCTGIHGANRLASNSLLECLVFGYRVAKDIEPKSFKIPSMITHSITPNMQQVKCGVLLEEVQKILTAYAYVFRTKQGLACAKQKIDHLFNDSAHRLCKTIEEVIAVNALYCARSIIYSAIAREDSLGAHQIIEYKN